MYYVTTMNQTSNEKTCLRGIIIGMKMFSTYPSMALHKTTGCRRREVDRLVSYILTKWRRGDCRSLISQSTLERRVWAGPHLSLDSGIGQKSCQSRKAVEKSLRKLFPVATMKNEVEEWTVLEPTIISNEKDEALQCAVKGKNSFTRRIAKKIYYRLRTVGL